MRDASCHACDDTSQDAGKQSEDGVRLSIRMLRNVQGVQKMLAQMNVRTPAFVLLAYPKTSGYFALRVLRLSWDEAAARVLCTKSIFVFDTRA